MAESAAIISLRLGIEANTVREIMKEYLDKFSPKHRVINTNMAPHEAGIKHEDFIPTIRSIAKKYGLTPKTVANIIYQFILFYPPDPF